MTETVFDEVHLAQFTGGDAELEAELRALFFSSCGEYLTRLARGAQDDGDAETWRRAAHALKGAAGNFGAVALAAQAKHAEHSAPDKELYHDVRAEVAKLERYFAARAAA